MFEVSNLSMEKAGEYFDSAFFRLKVGLFPLPRLSDGAEVVFSGLQLGSIIYSLVGLSLALLLGLALAFVY
jgi:hypothetical protein